MTVNFYASIDSRNDTKKTTKTYDFGYKLGAVKCAEEIGKRATVDESMIHNWRKNNVVIILLNIKFIVTV